MSPMRRSLTLRLPAGAPARRDDESEGTYRGRLRHAIQRTEADALAGRRWLVEES